MHIDWRRTILLPLVTGVLVLVAFGILWHSKQPHGARTEGQPSTRGDGAPVHPLPTPPTLQGPGPYRANPPRGVRPPAAPTEVGAGLAMPSGRPQILYPGTESFQSREFELLCVGQVKRLTGALLMYAMDYDDHLPIAGRWCDATYPYVKSDSLYHCPAAKDVYGYALNLGLDQQRPSEADIPARAMVLFESSAGKKNATDNGTSFCKPPRHPGGNTLGYLDGHAAVMGGGG